MTTRPLAGRRVVVLRAGGAADSVHTALVERGAAATTVRVADVADRPDEEVREGVGDLAGYRWVAVTSANAARRLALWAERWPAATRIAAVGPATAAVAEGLGLTVAVVGAGGTARSLAEALDQGPVLFLAASSARTDLARDLAARGIELATVVVYDVAPRALDADAVAALTTSEVVVALSPIALDALSDLDAASRAAVAALPLVAIGPTTGAHAEALGWPATVVASSRDAASVCDAVATALAAR